MAQCAMSGHEVHATDANKKSLEEAVPYCKDLVAKAAKKLKIDDPELPAKAASRITIHPNRDQYIEAARGCDVFFEVVFEDMKLKCTMLQEIMPKLPANVVFWSNTSSLNIDVLGEASGRPEKAVVVHGMNPVPLMPGVEIVPSAKTTEATVEFTRKALLDMKKAPFVAPNIPGFWVNRLLVPQMLDAMRLLEQGKIKVEDGDIGLNTSLGHPQGSFKLADFVSAPTMLRVALEMYQASNDPRMYPPMILVRMVNNGEMGAGTGKGFYDWSDPRNPKGRDMSQYVVGTAEDMTGHVK